GGIFKNSYAVENGIGNIIPVNVVVPGCPPTPIQIMQGIFRAINREHNSNHKVYKGHGDIIYRTSDAWGDILVIDDEHYRNLTFDSIYEQSRMDRRNPHSLVYQYTRAMMLVLAFIKPRHATILGLGGGCLLRSLYHVLPKCELHTIELRQRVY